MRSAFRRTVCMARLALRTKLFARWLLLAFSGGTASIGSSDCAICLCRMERGEETRELRCRHPFHKSCLDKWLEQPGRCCPVCREDAGAGEKASESRKRAELRDDGVIVFFPWEEEEEEEEDDFRCDAWWIR
ncbi:hypothetical protein BHM03_00037109 [Ensete ventricosum]|nr:hypothetical protein BHM03_00037109 [Ensete ventricosum]